MSDDIELFEDVTVPCNRVEQQTAFYCGAACCKMVLDIYNINITQAEAYSLIHNEERFAIEKLYSDPKGIADCLNIKTPNDINFEVKAFDSENQQSVINQIYFTLKFLRIPSLILVQKGNHWVVVSAVRMKEKENGKRELCGVFIQNPWYGSSPNKYVSVSEFISGWLTPIAWGKTWLNSMVAMSDGEQRTLRKISLLKDLNMGLSTLGWNTATGSEDYLLDALSRHGFNNIELMSGGGVPVLKPIDVDDLSTGDSYSIVPMDGVKEKNYRDFVYVAIDGKTGILLEIDKFGNALQIYSNEEATKVLQELYPSASKIEIDPKYYWKRSHQAMSRFDVLRKIKIDGKTGYLTSKGEVNWAIERIPVAGG